MNYTELHEIKTRINNCKSYNFGMTSADKLAHEDAPKLVEALEKAMNKMPPPPLEGSTYTYEDNDGKKLLVGCTPLNQVILVSFVDGIMESYITVESDGAFRLTYEILRKAGFRTNRRVTSEDISVAMGALLSEAERLEEADEREKARAEVCKELGAFYTPGAADSPLLRAVDLIIEERKNAKA